MTDHEFPYDRDAWLERFLNGLAQMDSGGPAWPVACANGVALATFRARLRRGWSGERAATEPVREDKPKRKCNDASELDAVKNGVSRRSYRARVRAGADPVQAALPPE